MLVELARGIRGIAQPQAARLPVQVPHGCLWIEHNPHPALRDPDREVGIVPIRIAGEDRIEPADLIERALFLTEQLHVERCATSRRSEDRRLKNSAAS